MLSAPSRPQFPHLHKEGFLQEHQFPCGEGQGHSHRPWLIIRVRAKAGLGSCQSTSPCDPQISLGPPALWEGAPRYSGWVGAGVVGKGSWALDSQTWRGGPPPTSWLDVFPRRERKLQEKTSFSLPFLTRPGQGGGSLEVEKWMNLPQKHGLAVLSVQSRAAGKGQDCLPRNGTPGWGTGWPPCGPVGESACWLESAL